MIEKVKEQFYFNKMRKGDMKAFEFFFKNYIDLLYAYALGLTRDKAESEDLVQETFIYFWNNRSKIDIENSVYGYLQRSIKNAYLNLKKHEAVRLKYEKEILSTEKETLEDEDYTAFDNRRKKLLESIGRLPEKSRSIFIMSAIEGMTYRDIARNKGISENTVKSQIRHSYKKLRSDLGLSESEVLLWIIIFLQ